MLAMLLPFFKGFLANWKLIIGAIFAAIIMVGIYSWDARGRAVDTLTAQVSTLQANLKAAQDEAKTAAIGQAVANARTTEQLAAQGRINKLVEDANHAQPKDDGAVAPVLRNALAGIAAGVRPPGGPVKAGNSPRP